MSIRYLHPPKWILAVSAVVFLAGCEQFGTADETYGVKPVTSPEPLQKIDLVSVLTSGGTKFGEADSVSVSAEKLEKAFKSFKENVAAKQAGAPSRNEVQDRIIAASNQACAEYESNLKAESTRWNLLLGGATTLSAGLGAIFTGADTVRALSGVAAILSGFRAEYNQEFMANLTVQVITDGIRSRRDELKTKIDERRTTAGADLSAYTVQRAIADAVEYHMSCSLVVGLEQAALSIERADNPGLEMLAKAYDNQKKLYDSQGMAFNVLKLRQLQLDALNGLTASDFQDGGTYEPGSDKLKALLQMLGLPEGQQ